MQESQLYSIDLCARSQTKHIDSQVRRVQEDRVGVR